MKKFGKVLLALILCLAVVSTTAFAGGQGEEKKGEVELVYVEWARAVAITHVAAEILERQGYEIKNLSVANSAMWASVAAGDSDALLCAWLPSTHADLYAEFEDDIVDLGPNYTGAKLGFVVPSYVTIDSTREMADHIDKFDGEIIGIDPGAGMSKATEKAIENNTSNLGEFEYVSGSDAIMVAALQDAIKNEEWIAVPGWAPHWMFGEWDLKILDDPDQIFGTEETINTVVRKGLKEDLPEVYEFFAEFPWPKLEGEMSKLLVMNKNNPGKVEQNAEEWVDDNWSTIESLLP
jgi:glycine betaine/proline transport system substrate-binding protein